MTRSPASPCGCWRWLFGSKTTARAQGGCWHRIWTSSSKCCRRAKSSCTPLAMLARLLLRSRCVCASLAILPAFVPLRASFVHVGGKSFTWCPPLRASAASLI
eukprot:6195618-Pleurochrysis_carterae.AAC.1